MLQYFTLALCLSLVAHLHLSRRLLAPWPLRPAVRRVLCRLLWLHAVLLPLAMVASLRAPAGWARWAVPMGRAAFFYAGLCLMLVVALLVRDLLLLARAVGRGRRGERPAQKPAENLPRRDWLRRALDYGVLLAAGGQAAVGYAVATRLPRVLRIALPVCDGGSALCGLRIAHLSDLHIGPTLRGDWLAALVAQVNGLLPDLIVITGDLIDGFVEQLADQVAALETLRAPLGCFFVTGNHEYFYRPQEWVGHLRRLGLGVLVNESRVLRHRGASLSLSGICDESAAAALPAHRPDLDRVAASLCRLPGPTPALRLLLAHRPRFAPRAAALGFDVQLSGHLHGGQFFPLTWLLRPLTPYVGGLYRVGSLHLYVSRGTGYWGPPMRHGAPPELALLTLMPRSP